MVPRVPLWTLCLQSTIGIYPSGCNHILQYREIRGSHCTESVGGLGPTSLLRPPARERISLRTRSGQHTARPLSERSRSMVSALKGCVEKSQDLTQVASCQSRFQSTPCVNHIHPPIVYERSSLLRSYLIDTISISRTSSARSSWLQSIITSSSNPSYVPPR